MSTHRAAGVLCIAVSLFAASCGGGEGAGVDSTGPTTTAASTTTATVTTTDPPAPTTTSTTTTAMPAKSLLLLAFGDSFASRHGWPSQYAALAGEALGREIEVGGEVCALGCADLLRVLERPSVRSLMAKADILVVQPRPGRVFSQPFGEYLDGTCGGDDGQECIRTALENFRLHVHELLDAATATVGEHAVIRTAPAGVWAIDHFYPGLRDADPDTFAVFLAAMAEYIRLTGVESAGRCIAMTDASALFNGVDYTQPIDPAYTRDGAHPSDEGSRIIAEDLHSLGYEPTAQSC